MSLDYPDKSNCVNILLIDSSIPSADFFSSSTNEVTLPIIYSYEDTKEELMTLLTQFTTIGRIGIAFTYTGPNQLFLNEQSFFENTEFMISLIQTFHVTNIDFLACNTLQDTHWTNYYALLSETGVIVGASNDRTGNLKYGGDWTMESTGEDIEMIYFTESIKYYSYLLDVTSQHTLVITTDKYVYSCGFNNQGQLGQSSTTSGTAGDSNYVIRIVSNFTNVTLCATSVNNSYIYNGTFYSCGFNSYGQLGIGSYDIYLTHTSFNSMTSPTNTSDATPVKMICGYLFMAVLYSNQTVYVCGNNTQGQLCQSLSNTRVTSLTQLSNLTGKSIWDISLGDYHILVLMTDGSIYVSGNNDYGQLGSTSGLSRTTLQTVENGTNSTTVSLYNQLTLFPNNTKLIPQIITCGSFHNIIVMNNGTIWANGLNDFGQLGIGTTGSAIGPNSTSYVTSLTPMSITYVGLPIAVACGQKHTVVMTISNGTYYLYATGLNNYGQLGTGNLTNYNVLTPMNFYTNTPTNTTFGTTIPYNPISISCGCVNTWVLCNNNYL